MIFSWLRRRRRRKLLAQPFPEAWLPWLLNLPFYQGLDEDERARLHDILRVIVAEKNWEGCGGLEITEEMKVVVAAQAALLLLGIEHDHHRRARTILIYPSTYKLDGIRQEAGGIIGEGAHVAGQAWYRGPVILSWDAVEHGAWDPKDGHNLVLHEFAHKLDMLDGYIDGTPQLEDRADYRIWTQIMTVEYRAHQEATRKGRGTVMDRYGALNEGEFFAVATESFFEKPLQMEKRHPDLYGLLRAYYHQHPAERLRRAHGAGTGSSS